ncbi:peptidoglycan DD-metalloendopeptidase family protein [Methylomarinum vadi]|uniref:peptidoglycan DD-metalloendopeptidase family protein n=1 Tax=Methylomarinum vadi TaxID=438855 RepID=UPI000AE0A959|nr:peptidoglycan DD-metalloendopeptidase family protein [Methylomarinum vadi]
MLTLLLTGCAGNGNYAPVRNYYRDIPKSQQYYTVKKGDTLYAIGFRSGHGYKRLAKWNKIYPPYRLYVGQKIKLFKPKQKLSTAAKKGTGHRSIKKTRNLSQKSPTFSNDKKKVLKLHWQWPIKGKVLKSFSQTGKKGIDIGGSLGQPVKAAAAGKVVYSGHGLVGYGNLLIIKHNSLYLSAYGNNRRLLVKEGQTVSKGQTIAEVGKAGGSQTSLHFEIRKKGKPVNPVDYLPTK